MSNRVSYIKDLKGYQLVMVLGYLGTGKCSLFVRNDKNDKVLDFGIVDTEMANNLFKFLDLNLTIESGGKDND